MLGRICKVVMLFLVFPLLARSQSPTSDQDAFIQKHQYDPVKVTWTHLDDYAAGKVFAYPIYRITIATKEGFGQSNYGNNLVVVRVGDGLVPIPQPSRDGDLTALLTLLRPDFRLTNDDLAETFQTAFDLIYPANQDNRWGEKFLHEGNQWTFIRGGRYFSGGGGYWDSLVVKVDDQGAIMATSFVHKPSAP